MTLAEFINRVGFKVNEQDVNKVNNTIKNIKSTATKLLGVIGIGISLSQLNAIAEEFNGINDKLNYALGYSEDMKDVQKDILAGANRCRVAYSNMVDTVVSLKQASSDIFPVEDAAVFVEYLNKLGKSAGYSDGEISSMQNSIQRVVAAGVMSGADITRMARQTPALVEKICEGLGVTREQLDAMADSGQVTAATIKQAIMNSADSIDASFDKLDYSLSDAMLNIRNQWGYFVDDLNASTGLTQTIAKALTSGFEKVMSVLTKVRNGVVWLVDKLGGMENVLKLVGIIAGATLAVMNFDKISKGVTSIVKLFTSLGKGVDATKLKILGIIAIVVVIALLIEDFINFMQGNDSVIGTLFEKAGIDADKARQTIIDVWNTVKGFLLQVWGVIKKAASEIFGALSAWWKENGESVKKSFTEIWNSIKNLCSAVWNALKTAAIAIFGALQKFWAKWGDKIIAAFKVIWNTLTSLIKPFLNAIAGIIDFIANVFTGDWKGAWESVKKIAASIWEAIKAVFKGAWEYIKIVWSVVSEFFQGVWDGIVSVFQGVVDWFAGIFNDAWEAIKGVFATVGEFFQGVWDTIVELFTSIGTAVSDAISGAVKGAINAVLSGAIGIINGFISAINAAISVINAIPGVEIKKIAKLEVPQLAKGGYVGPNKPQPVIIGDNRNEGEIVSPISKMRDTVISALRQFKQSNKGDGSKFGEIKGFLSSAVQTLVKAAKPTGALQTLHGETSNRTINQTVTINNKFEGDKAIQRDASKAMDKSAKDVTSELARGLAYAK